MPRLPAFKSQLASLPHDPTTEDLQPLAKELADRCGVERYPKKSIAAVLRHARSIVPEATVSALLELTESALEARVSEPNPTPIPATEPFLGIAEAARRLNLSVKGLADRLREVRFRRLYGWPWWDGHQWSFSAAALDPVTRSQYMADLPEQEPSAHVAMLPSWCQRQDSDVPPPAT